MSWLRQQIAPSPHLLDPAETEQASRRYYHPTKHMAREVIQAIADQKRAIEHEHAVLRGMEAALSDHEGLQSRTR